MQDTTRATRFIGLDVSKKTIAVAIADEGREKARYYGGVENTPEKVRHLMKNLGPTEELLVCYEAGPTGYGLYRQLTRMGIACMVVAPSLIPHRAGDRVKTDRRDALRLAELLRAGELTPVWVPGEGDEALRDLVRAREDAVSDRLRARHRLSKFLLRHDLRPLGKIMAWTSAHRQWLDTLHLDGPKGAVLREYLHAIDEIQGRIDRLDQEIHQVAETCDRAPVIRALQALRGVQEVTAATLVAEVGEFSRFKSATQLMAYAGVVPKERSSGEGRWQGSITKTGNAHLRRITGEAAFAYRHQPATGARLRKRQEGLTADVIEIAWNAQVRLHGKYVRLSMRGKGGGVTATAVARELLGFIWAIGCAVEAKNRGAQAAAA